MLKKVKVARMFAVFLIFALLGLAVLFYPASSTSGWFTSRVNITGSSPPSVAVGTFAVHDYDDEIEEDEEIEPEEDNEEIEESTKEEYFGEDELKKYEEEKNDMTDGTETNIEEKTEVADDEAEFIEAHEEAEEEYQDAWSTLGYF
jgi:uncharacterized membrane protein YukC